MDNTNFETEALDNMLEELTALEAAVIADITGLGNLGGTVDNSVSLGAQQVTGTNPDGGEWTGTFEISVGLTITQGEVSPFGLNDPAYGKGYAKPNAGETAADYAARTGHRIFNDHPANEGETIEQYRARTGAPPAGFTNMLAGETPEQYHARTGKWAAPRPAIEPTKEQKAGIVEKAGGGGAN